MTVSNLPFYEAQENSPMKRRDFLRVAATTMSLATVGTDAVVKAESRSHSRMRGVPGYLESLRRSDGGYAWEDQARSHLTPSFAAVACYHLLRQDPPDKGALAEFLRTHHPFRLKKLERDLKVFEFQQIQSLLWLGQDVSSFQDQIKSWTKPSVYPSNYERHSYPILHIEVMALLCRHLMSLPLDDIRPELIEYIDARRRPNGSFNNTPASDGHDGHVMNTWWAIQALATLGRSHEKREETVDWVQKCQMSGGGFTYQPAPAFAAIEDITYTWAAVRILRHLDASPDRREACINHLGSLRNEDGGSSDQPGWPSNPMATYRALDAIQSLSASDRLVPTGVAHVRRKERRQLPKDLKVFTTQIEAHGKGSCIDAVELARALRIDLWGAKNAAPGWIAKAQHIADQRKVPVRFYVANEEYGTFVSLPGLGTYSHTSDIMAPADVDCGPSLSAGQAVSWEEYRRERLVPLHKAGGRLIWQFNENEELTRLYLDDSLERGGYAAICTFHFGNPDFTNSEPFLQHYWQQIPFVALQDAHGEEPWWWADQLTGFRTLFLATEPTWKAWLTALRHNWVVAVRHDRVSNDETWMHGGPPEVVDFVRRQEPQWRWWDNPSIERPLVSIVAVTPDDRWEAARPERGVTVRVRCRWDNTLQGLPKTPRVELLELAVDGRRVTPTLVAPEAKWGAYRDHYHYYHIANPATGRHTATATIHVRATKARSSHAIEFMV